MTVSFASVIGSISLLLSQNQPRKKSVYLKYCGLKIKVRKLKSFIALNASAIMCLVCPITNTNYSTKSDTARCLRRKYRTYGQWAYRRLLHEKAFARVKEYVEDTVIVDNGICKHAELYDLYVTAFQEANTEGRKNLEQTAYASHHLLKQILERFPTLTKSVHGNRANFHRTDLSTDKLLEMWSKMVDDVPSRIKSIAFEIRQKVMGMEKRFLPRQNISAEQIIHGECNIPTELFTLIKCLVCGSRASLNERKNIKIESICNSIIFSATNGAVKPSSCLSLGLVTKSITGSRRMIEILNRLGHSISYTSVEEIKTELAYGGAAAYKVLPNGLVASPTLRTQVAFDNFDRFVETSNGKDTLHDTVGIVYQNVAPNIDMENRMIADLTRDDGAIGQGRRKYLSSFESFVPEYVKQSKALPMMVGIRDEIPRNWQTSINLNHMWMFSHVLSIDRNIDEVYRWSGWNAQRTVDVNPMHNIAYLPNLNMSPTADAVVCKTLETALSIAEECGQKFIIVTYDLAIACKAYRIQVDQSSRFEKIFITLGAFHIQLSFFKVQIFY